VATCLGRGSVEVVRAEPFFRFPGPARDRGHGHGGRTDRGGDGPASGGFPAMSSQAEATVMDRAGDREGEGGTTNPV
jgi:hypothetical protein